MTRRYLLLFQLACLLSFGSGAFAQNARTDTLLYVGTYSERGSEGIYVFGWDGASRALRPIETQGGLESPSFLALHPEGHTLYSVNREGVAAEPGSSSVTAYAIAGDSGKLEALNSASTFGQGGCYVAADASGQHLFAGNYSSGTFSHYRLAPDGSIGEVRETVAFEGNGPVEGRQEEPHVHATTLSPDNRHLYVPDLGGDQVGVYRLTPAGELELVQMAKVNAGTGPRHLAFHPEGRFAYVAGELNSTIVAFERLEDGRLLALEQHSTLPATFTGTNYDADIHVHPNGRFVYVSNRGHNSIAWFRIDPESGRLSWGGVVSTHGDWPRNFSLTPDGRFLLVANRRTDSITLFSIDPGTGKPGYTGESFSVPSPVCLVFRTPPG